MSEAPDNVLAALDALPGRDVVLHEVGVKRSGLTPYLQFVSFNCVIVAEKLLG